jgi:hypothetical protein
MRLPNLPLALSLRALHRGRCLEILLEDRVLLLLDKVLGRRGICIRFFVVVVAFAFVMIVAGRLL